MGKIAQITGVGLLLIMALASFPGGVWAQTAGVATETVTVQLDSVSPSGVHIIGTLVVKRTPSTEQAELKFNGTIEGKPASATAHATEAWSGSSKGEINVTEITSWNASIPQPATMKVELAQAGPGLITINGVPLATSANLVPPGSGSRSYVVTNAGTGGDTLTLLPQTGAGNLMSDPLMIAMFLVTAGPALVVIGAMISKLARKNAGSVMQGAK